MKGQDNGGKSQLLATAAMPPAPGTWGRRWWELRLGFGVSGSCTRFWKFSVGQLGGREAEAELNSEKLTGTSSFHRQKVVIMGGCGGMVRAKV